MLESGGTPPRARSGTLWCGAVALVLGVLGCGTSRPWEIVPSPARDLPQEFVADTAYPRPPVAPGTAQACLARLIDPRNGVRLTLRRSAESRGDYAVDPAGRYGVGTLELLRVECGTGRPLGIVPQSG